MSSQGLAVHSLVTFKNSQGITARGTLLKLDRSTVVFEVYNPYSIVQVSEVLQELTLLRGDRVIYQGRGMVSTLVNTGLMLIVSVSLVDSWQDLAGLLENSHGIRTEVKRFIDDWQSAHQVRPDYQLAVGNLRSFCYELSRWLEEVDLMAEEKGIIGNPSIEREFFAELSSPIIPRVAELLGGFEDIAITIPEPEVVIHKTYAQRDLHPLFMRAPFIHRAFHKPLGYAGDYEMVNMMLNDSYSGPTIYSRIINTTTLLAGPVRAHRNRIDILERILNEINEKGIAQNRSIRVLNVGCGPAVELQRFITNNPLCGKLHFTLIDFSQETLDYTRAKLDSCAAQRSEPPVIDYIHQSVHDLLKQATNRKKHEAEVQYDFVYCAGLFDYLSDKVCARLIQLFHQWTAPGGKVLVTNVHLSNPSRGLMEHIMEWYLIYRDEKQMEVLASATGYNKMYTDDTGVNIFLEIDKPPAGNKA